MLGYLAVASVLVAAVASVPLLVELITRRKFPVHTSGAVIVTGASSGVGRDLVQALARDGFTVFAGVRKAADLEDLQALKLPNLRPVILDVTLQDHVDALYELLRKDGIKLVALINSAGISGSAPTELLELDKFDLAFNANVRGPLLMMQKFLPMLRENKGRIVNVSSITTALRFGGSGAYSASKCALESITDQLRREMYMEGYEVAVVIVQPGTIKTPIWDKATQAREASGSEQLMKLYPKVAAWGHALIKVSQRNGETPARSTTPTIREALMSPYPKTRYQCSHISKVVPAAVMMWFAWFFPDRVMDFFLSKKP